MKNTKKIFLIILSLVLTLVFTSCSNIKQEDEVNIGSDERIINAIETIKECWEKDYSKNEIEDRFLKIIDTKIININKDIDSEKIHNKDDLFKEVDYIVEFELISNYFDTSPYYSNAMSNNCVVVYRDGSAKVQRNPLLLYRTTTYSNDFSPIIESIEEMDAQYNHVIKFD